MRGQRVPNLSHSADARSFRVAPGPIRSTRGKQRPAPRPCCGRAAPSGARDSRRPRAKAGRIPARCGTSLPTDSVELSTSSAGSSVRNRIAPGCDATDPGIGREPKVNFAGVSGERRLAAPPPSRRGTASSVTRTGSAAPLLVALALLCVVERASGGDPLVAKGMSGMSNYERMRDERIRANRQLMIDLGLESAVKGLSALAPAPAPRKPAAPRAPREKKEKAEELPSRRSKRLRSGAKKEGQDAEDDDGEEEELLELVEEPKERVYRPRAGRRWRPSPGAASRRTIPSQPRDAARAAPREQTDGHAFTAAWRSA